MEEKILSSDRFKIVDWDSIIPLKPSGKAKACGNLITCMIPRQDWQNTVNKYDKCKFHYKYKGRIYKA